jgi:5-methyltetrahydrofolate--homocysteine methyltransferase
VEETLRTVSLVREELGLNTLLGVSNISYGLPAREFLNAAFLSMAVWSGLSAAIVNPFNETSMGLLAASRVILNQDRQAAGYITLYGGGRSDETAPDKADEDRKGALGKAVVNGHPEKAGELAVALLDEGYAPMEIGEKVLIPAMSDVGDRFAKNEYFLPQVLMSAKAMQTAFEPLREAMKGLDIPSAGKILMATVEGDIHDIGKNIVITLLENHGFEVLDLGKNIPADELVREASRPGIDAVGLSALMTTTMVHMENAVKELREAGLDIPVVVGGAAVTPEYASEIGADGYAGDATQAVKVFLELLQGSR